MGGCIEGAKGKLHSPDSLLGAWAQGVILRPLHKLEVAHSGQFQAEVLHGGAAAIDDCHVQHDVVLVHRHVRLCVHWVRQPCAAPATQHKDILAPPSLCSTPDLCSLSSEIILDL